MASENKAEEPKQPETFKDQLDLHATESRNADTKKDEQNPIVEKIIEYVPAAASILGGSKEDETPKVVHPEPSIAPQRPHHDQQIEEFVRDQHRSKTEDSALNTKE